MRTSWAVIICLGILVLIAEAHRDELNEYGDELFSLRERVAALEAKRPKPRGKRSAA